MELYLDPNSCDGFFEFEDAWIGCSCAGYSHVSNFSCDNTGVMEDLGVWAYHHTTSPTALHPPKLPFFFLLF